MKDDLKDICTDLYSCQSLPGAGGWIGILGTSSVTLSINDKNFLRHQQQSQK